MQFCSVVTMLSKIVSILFWWRKAKTVKVHVVEKADFTDFGQVTGWLEADISIEEFLKRPEVWGKSARKGILRGKQDCVLLQAGEDIVTANEKLRGRESEPDILFELSDEPELFEVTDAKYVQYFREREDFHGLPAAVSTFSGDSARERYRLVKKAKEAGYLVWELNQNQVKLWFSKYWGFAFLTLSLIIFICVTIIGVR